MQALSRASTAAWRHLLRCISIDTRALAAFRILAGLLIISDLVLRAQHFTRFYTEDGVVPKAVALEAVNDGAFSFFLLTTSTPVSAALFVLQGLIAVLLLAGYRTWLATFLSFLFVVSLDHRNALILSHADTLFRLLMFWAIFLPLGARWSIDALQTEGPRRTSVTNLASAAILLQMVFMYFVNGMHKTTSDLWNGGDATPLIFGLDDTTFLLGPALRAFPAMLEASGYLWYGSLVASPLLLLLPGRWRLPLVALFLGGHLAFAFTVRIGAFPWVAIAGVLLFLQAEFWEDAAHLLRRLGLHGRIEGASRRLEAGARSVARRLPSYRPWEAVPEFTRATIRDTGVIVAVLVVLVIPGLERLAEHDVVHIDTGEIGRETQRFAATFGVRQSTWRVFAPNPRTVDRYHVIAARAADGSMYDLYNDRELTFERPYRRLYRQYPSYRDRFYMSSVRDAGFTGGATPALAEYLCDQWRDERDIEIEVLEMWVIEEQVTRETLNDPQNRWKRRDLFYRHGCNGHEAVELNLESYF